MAAFEPILSGIPGLDKCLDFIRLGDNVVWQVSDLEEFRYFARAFAGQAVRDGRNILYIRFAGHEPILPKMPGVWEIHVPLSHLFESFTVDIHNLIEQEGRDAFYVFDCLSELEEAWATDLMMGNFFHLTCPFLFQLDTVAYFPILRGRHSFDAIDVITNTTQLFLDIFPGGRDKFFFRAEKVWERPDAHLAQPYGCDLTGGKFYPVSESVELSRFYRGLNDAKGLKNNRSMDSWERFFHTARVKFDAGLDIGRECDRMCDIMLTRDTRMRDMIVEQFQPEDYFEIHDRMIGTGLIGGKACGMLLSRKIIQNRDADLFERIEPHDSFYIGSDVFYSFIVNNGLWDLKLSQKTEDGYFSQAQAFSEALLHGEFSAQLRARFRQLLEYYGNEPIIVRSSSILEDGFGNAFAGKYESVFCGNHGSPEDRLTAFESAIRTVYASTVSLSALDYRKRRGLEHLDEQMGILVQRVSGSHYDGFFMPCAAGVGYSSSPYRFGVAHPEKGMLRLVCGLGTAAVDRRTGSYPRMVALDKPNVVWQTSSADRHQFSQRLVDVISDGSDGVENRDAERVRASLPPYLTALLFSHDRETETILREQGIREEVLYVSCEGLVSNRALMRDMGEILRLLQDTYAYPVDIEYTINCSASGEYVISLLQCRPLQLTRTGEKVSIPTDLREEDILIETVGTSMGFSRSFPLDVLVYVDSVAYYRLPYREKYRVKQTLSAINWKLRGQNKRMLLITPGRICTSSPELGVPTDFSDISEFDTILEVADSRAGYMPELSYGSHIFQDLVEAEILYTAVFEGNTTRFVREQALKSRNDLADFLDSPEGMQEVVYLQSQCGLWEYYDLSTERFVVLKRTSPDG
ncbi:MAG: phosphoenolpyruvate synthase [Oscillospiraceae bacterium]|nr:phosphoenolpyruvate synthase [Oscillospiraceae bacterium]